MGAIPLCLVLDKPHLFSHNAAQACFNSVDYPHKPKPVAYM